MNNSTPLYKINLVNFNTSIYHKIVSLALITLSRSSFLYEFYLFKVL